MTALFLLLLAGFSLAAAPPSETAAITHGRALQLAESRYEIGAGSPARLSAATETLEFLKSAKTRTVELNGAKAPGLAVGEDESGNVVVAASMRATPGTYTVAVSAVSDAGEQRETTMSVTVKPRVTVPSGSTRNPVVLLNGWQTGVTGTCAIQSSSSSTFGNLASYLIADGVPVVYFFDNCAEDANTVIETLGNDLGDFLATIKYDDGTQVPQIDLVAFSMGGLIARSYLAGLQTGGVLTPPTTTLVGKLVLIAVPNFGSFVAGNYSTSLSLVTQSAEIVPGSSFLWDLANWNQRTDDLRGVSAIAIVGNAGTYSPDLTSGIVLNNASDGLVSLASASMGFVTQQAYQTRIVPYCHVDPSAFTTGVFGTYACNAIGIANVTSTSHLTGQIVRSFLGDTTDWKSIGTIPTTSGGYLATNGGFFFALVNSANVYMANLTQVLWGTVSLTNSAALNSIYYGDFLNGTGVLSASSSSLGTVNCGSYAVAFGYFSAVRCKINAAILSIGPLTSSYPRVVTSGGNITITGASFSTKCSNCRVTATPAGSSTATVLTTSAWSNNSITAALPSSYSGLVTITVYAVSGTDAIAIMATPAAQSTITTSPTSLGFSYTAGGATPASQTFQVTNTGGGTLTWSAASSASWLTVSPASGTAPSTVTVSVSPGALDAGSYTGTITITASGASNSPQSVAVSLTVAASPAVLTVSPTSLQFSYTVGGSVPTAQTAAIGNSGGGTLAWTASDSDYWVALSATSGTAPAAFSISLNPVNLAAGTYTSTLQVAASGATGSPVPVTITLTVTGSQPAPAVTAAANGASYKPGFASATWVSIFGTNLSSSTYTWQDSDFVNGALPASLQGVSVTINGVAAYVEFISPSQINVLAPDDTATGPVQIVVTTAGQTSNSLTATRSAFSPAFFSIANGAYIAAQHPDYTLVGSTGLIGGVTSKPASVGETILLYATGFGPANPALPTGQLVSAPAALASQVTVTMGGVSATVVYAGLIGPGLYQLNVTVPAVPSGDAAVVATVGGVSTQSGISITVQ